MYGSVGSQGKAVVSVGIENEVVRIKDESPYVSRALKLENLKVGGPKVEVRVTAAILGRVD
jgi:hypothetical protein